MVREFVRRAENRPHPDGRWPFAELRKTLLAVAIGHSACYRGATAPREIVGESLQGSRELGILDLPERMPHLVLRQQADRGKKLAETHLGAQFAHFCQSREHRGSQITRLHIVSAIRGLWAFGWRSFPSTST